MIPLAKVAMKKNYFPTRFLLALFVVCTFGSAEASKLCAQTPRMTAGSDVLDRYVKSGLRDNESLKQQGFLLQKSLAALKEARTLFLPNVALSMTYTRANGGRTIEFPVGDLLNPVYSSLNQLTRSEGFPRLENASILLNPNDFYDAKIRTSAPLYNVEIQYNERVKSEQTTLQQLELALYKRELVRDIKKAYYQYAQSAQAVDIYESALRLAHESERINTALFINQKVNRTTLARAENEVRKIEAALHEAMQTRSSAAAYFNFLLNKPLGAPVEADTTLLNTPLPPTTAPLLAERTTADREERAKLNAAQRISDNVLGLASSHLLPKLSVFVDVGSQGFEWRVNNRTFYYFAGISLDWSIFTFGKDTHKIEQATAEADAIRSQTRYVEQQLALQLLTARNAYAAARTNCDAARSREALAERYFNDMVKLYKEGQALFIELLDAQNQLIAVRLQRSIAQADALTKLAEIERAAASFSLE
jgi:outer membrane protein TolC